MSYAGFLGKWAGFFNFSLCKLLIYNLPTTNEKLPGWESFGSLIKHFQFVKEHHKKVSHVALVTDSVLGDFGEKIADHFVSAEIKHFAFGELNNAQNWILNTGSK